MALNPAEKSSHTPAGNWRAYESAGFKGEWGVETDDPAMVEAGDEIIVYPSLSEEHARLIAAAPTMFAYISKLAEAGYPEAAKIMEAIHANA